MTTYTIELDNDTLKVDFNRDIPAKGCQIVRDAERRLDEMLKSGEFKGGSLLKIFGPQSLPVCYAITHKVAHLYGAIAVSDPRIGYVVVISTTPAYQVGDRIEFAPKSSSNEPQEFDNFANTTEPAFFINLEGDTLKVGFNPKVKAEGDQVVKDAAAQLDKLEDLEKLKGKLLKIEGRASVLASYVIAHKIAHLYGAIAIFDPKIGDKGLDKYIVAISHEENYRVGDTFDIEYNPQPNIKVVLCGPENTGKTVLRDGLKEAISKLNDAPTDFFVISGCPDGDGAWFSETARNNPALAKELKKAYKANFTPEFAQQKAQVIKYIKNSLLLFDVGGKVDRVKGERKITPENKIIMSEATHAVILAKTEADVTEWQSFCQQLNLPVIAIIYSALNNKEDVIETLFPLLTGSVHSLNREEDVFHRPMIQALANLIVSLTKS